MAKPLHPEQRRRRLIDRTDSAAFWTVIGALLGVAWLTAGGWPLL